MVAIAGGDALLATPGERSTNISWEQVLESDPEVVVVMPCGFHLEEAIAQYRNTCFPKDWMNVSAVRHRRVYAVDTCCTDVPRMLARRLPARASWDNCDEFCSYR
jgi:iron complex transport system substrate-binding protein